MVKLFPDSSINQISKYLKEIVDRNSGHEIIEADKKEILEIFSTEVFCRKIYKGKEYSKTFVTILRQYRIDIIEQVLNK